MSATLIMRVFPMFVEPQQIFVLANDELRAGFDGTFQDAVVRRIPMDHIQGFGRCHQLRDAPDSLPFGVMFSRVDVTGSSPVSRSMFSTSCSVIADSDLDENGVNACKLLKGLAIAKQEFTEMEPSRKVTICFVSILQPRVCITYAPVQLVGFAPGQCCSWL
jgi:hypothetical protein